MSKNNKHGDSEFVCEGVVTQCLSNGMFRVRLVNGSQVIAHLSGKIRRNLIKILLGDTVKIAFSAYNLSRGRIIYRFKPYKKKSK